MDHLDTAIADWGSSLGLPSLALDDRGCATVMIGEGNWILQAIDNRRALMLAHTIDVPFCTAQQLETALVACHAHMQPAHHPSTLRLGTRGRGASTQWVGCLRLDTPDSRTLASGVATLLQWLEQCARDAQVTGRH
jgi:hypothetical protein